MLLKCPQFQSRSSPSQRWLFSSCRCSSFSSGSCASFVAIDNKLTAMSAARNTSSTWRSTQCARTRRTRNLQTTPKQRNSTKTKLTCVSRALRTGRFLEIATTSAFPARIPQLSHDLHAAWRQNRAPQRNSWRTSMTSSCDVTTQFLVRRSAHHDFVVFTVNLWQIRDTLLYEPVSSDAFNFMLSIIRPINFLRISALAWHRCLLAFARVFLGCMMVYLWFRFLM